MSATALNIPNLPSSTVPESFAAQTMVSNRVVTRHPGRSEVAIRVFFEVEGCGNFRAADFDTASGTNSAWVKPKSVVRLEARPLPGHRFSHWVVENEFAGGNRSRRVVAARGMIIRAVFVPLSNDDIRC